MAKRGELQLRVFCIYKRPAALRSKKSAAVLQHFYFLLGMMCHGALGIPARSVLRLQKDRCFKGQKICSNSSTLPAGDDVRWAQGVSVRSVLHLQKTRSLRSKKSAAALQHFYFLLGMMCHGAWGVPARSVLHLQKTRCLEGAGKAALELDAACPSLTGFQFHVYSNASCGSQFQSRADFSALTKSSEDFETAEALRLELPRAPSTKISHLKLPRAPSTRIPHLKLPRVPSTRIPI